MTTVVLAILLADPQTFTARVVGVHDGDTITVLQGTTQHKIRLSEVDAPELGQPFGASAKQSLSEMVAGRDVRIVWRSRDRYGRILGDVYRDDRWINHELVEGGMAWQYVRYDRSASLRIAEHFARDNAYGLWADRDPIPPWEWRRTERDRHRTP